MPLRPKANGRGAALGGGDAAIAVIQIQIYGIFKDVY